VRDFKRTMEVALEHENYDVAISSGWIAHYFEQDDDMRHGLMMLIADTYYKAKAYDISALLYEKIICTHGDRDGEIKLQQAYIDALYKGQSRLMADEAVHKFMAKLTDDDKALMNWCKNVLANKGIDS
jgi:hypothetical protein